MKTVLVVTYYFPPSGGPGVQRVLKFIKYLPAFGWRPVVLTAQDADYPARDESLLSEIPETTTVYRSAIFEPYRLYRRITGKPPGAPVDVENIPQPKQRRSLTESLAAFVRSTFFIPDARAGWFPYAVREAQRIMAHEHIDAIYSSSPPYTAALIARTLHRQTELPWVAGFRDPWTGFLSTPERWFLPRALDCWYEREVFRGASAVEVAWKGIIKDVLGKYPLLPKGKFRHLPNGFDPEDYPSGDFPRNERFTVTYAGSMYGRRNPATFLKAIEHLVNEGQVEAQKLRLRFVGRFGGEVRHMLESSSVKECIDIVPYLPHRESILELLKADLLLLVVDETADSEEIVPGKVYEYLGARTPILALAREGAVAELIRETSAGVVRDNQDVAGIKDAFLEHYRNFVYDRPRPQQNTAAVKRYERREVTRQLAALLDSLTHQPAAV